MEDGRRYAGGKAFFETDHLSVYVVTYDETREVTPSGGGNGCAAGAFGLAAAAAVLAAVSRKRRD
jgi:hypothetical protein